MRKGILIVWFYIRNYCDRFSSILTTLSSLSLTDVIAVMIGDLWLLKCLHRQLPRHPHFFRHNSWGIHVDSTEKRRRKVNSGAELFFISRGEKSESYFVKTERMTQQWKINMWLLHCWQWCWLCKKIGAQLVGKVPKISGIQERIVFKTAVVYWATLFSNVLSKWPRGVFPTYNVT